MRRRSAKGEGTVMSAYDYIPKLYDVAFDAPSSDRQSDEFFSATIDGETRRFNIHDYDTLYGVPWLYDIALYHNLACATPTEMSGAIAKTLEAHGVNAASRRVLELGAGSGAFGHELRHTVGVGYLAGLDISERAALAAERDRAGLYDAYHVADLTALDETTKTAIAAAGVDTIAMASATGWGNHIPVAGFETSFQLLPTGGWYIFHVKPNDPDPECIDLCHWVDGKIRSGALDMKYRASHFHRESSGGGKIFYDVVIGVKR